MTEHNLRQIFKVVSDTVHDHCVEFATAAPIAAVSWLLGLQWARAEWGATRVF